MLRYLTPMICAVSIALHATETLETDHYSVTFCNDYDKVEGGANEEIGQTDSNLYSAVAEDGLATEMLYEMIFFEGADLPGAQALLTLFPVDESETLIEESVLDRDGQEWAFRYVTMD